MSQQVIIFDTTLRDGEQALQASLSVKEKLQIALALERMGVDVMEVGFPVSSPGDFESVQTIARQVKNSRVCALARCVEKDIDVAAESLKVAEAFRIHTFIATSPMHIATKLRSTLDEVIERAIYMVKRARNYTDDVEFSCEDAGRTPIADLARVVEAAINAGATTINIPDTVGYTMPFEFAGIISGLYERVPNIDKAIISVHTHDDLGLAVGNSLAAVHAGARQVEGAMNGIGERAGNTSLEEVAMIFKSHKDLGIVTNINTPKIYNTSRLVSSLMNMPVQPNKAIVGRNAFAHSSGIHQDGVLKNRESYEIIDPKDIGLDENSIVLTARSGRAALKHRLHVLGIELEKEALDKAYEGFLRLADRKKDINDDDIMMLVGKHINKDARIKLDYLQVTSGVGLQSVASVRLDIASEKFEACASGNGPVDAAISAIKQIIHRQMVVKEFLIQAITKGSNDVGKVHMTVEYDGNSYYGFSANTDIVAASAEAFINAINKFVH